MVASSSESRVDLFNLTEHAEPPFPLERLSCHEARENRRLVDSPEIELPDFPRAREPGLVVRLFTTSPLIFGNTQNEQLELHNSPQGDPNKTVEGFQLRSLEAETLSLSKMLKSLQRSESISGIPSPALPANSDFRSWSRVQYDAAKASQEVGSSGNGGPEEKIDLRADRGLRVNVEARNYGFSSDAITSAKFSTPSEELAVGGIRGAGEQTNLRSDRGLRVTVEERSDKFRPDDFTSADFSSPMQELSVGGIGDAEEQTAGFAGFGADTGLRVTVEDRNDRLGSDGFASADFSTPTQEIVVGGGAEEQVDSRSDGVTVEDRNESSSSSGFANTNKDEGVGVIGDAEEQVNSPSSVGPTKENLTTPIRETGVGGNGNDEEKTISPFDRGIQVAVEDGNDELSSVRLTSANLSTPIQEIGGSGSGGAEGQTILPSGRGLPESVKDGSEDSTEFFSIDCFTNPNEGAEEYTISRTGKELLVPFNDGNATSRSGGFTNPNLSTARALKSRGMNHGFSFSSRGSTSSSSFVSASDLPLPTDGLQPPSSSGSLGALLGWRSRSSSLSASEDTSASNLHVSPAEEIQVPNMSPVRGLLVRPHQSSVSPVEETRVPNVSQETRVQRLDVRPNQLSSQNSGGTSIGRVGFREAKKKAHAKFLSQDAIKQAAISEPPVRPRLSALMQKLKAAYMDVDEDELLSSMVPQGLAVLDLNRKEYSIALEYRGPPPPRQIPKSAPISYPKGRPAPDKRSRHASSMRG